MLRSGRFIVLAIAGLILLTGAQQPAKQSETTKSNKQTKSTTFETTTPAKTPEPPYRAYPDKYADTCYDAEDHDSADLCAQWRAAIAAEKAAKEAARATNWAIVATLLSFLGISGLIFTIWQTHGALKAAREGNRISMKASARATRQAVTGAADTAKALKLAERNANAATETVDQMRKNSLVELRPWLTFNGFNSAEITDNNGIFAGHRFTFTFKNSGRVPAVNINVLNKCVVRPFVDEQIPEFEINNKTFNRSGAVGPGFDITATPIHPGLLISKELANMKIKLFVHHLLTYTDPRDPTLDYKTESMFALFYSHEETADGRTFPVFQIIQVGSQNRIC